MRSHYQRIAKQLAAAITRLDVIVTERNLAALHELVVDLKTSLPERLSYENSPLLLDGLRVTSPDSLPEYATRLRERLVALRDEYQRRG